VTRPRGTRLRVLLDDTGGAGVVGVALLTAAALLSVALLAAAGLLVERQRTAGAADAAALAAADVLAGLEVGDPCGRAGAVAAATGHRVVACALDGPVTTVTASAVGSGPLVSATASAGPEADEAGPGGASAAGVYGVHVDHAGR